MLRSLFLAIHSAKIRRLPNPLNRSRRVYSQILEGESYLIGDGPHEELAPWVLHDNAHAFGTLPRRNVEYVRPSHKNSALPFSREEGSRQAVDQA